MKKDIVIKILMLYKYNKSNIFNFIHDITNINIVFDQIIFIITIKNIFFLTQNLNHIFTTISNDLLCSHITYD